MINRTPFYKIQYYIDRTMSWMDLQIRFETIADAVNTADQSRKFRVMCIDGKNRTIVSHDVPTS